MNKVKSNVTLSLDSIVSGKLDLEIAYAYKKFGSKALSTVDEWARWMSMIDHHGKTEEQLLTEFATYKQMIINCPDEFLKNLRNDMGYMIYEKE